MSRSWSGPDAAARQTAHPAPSKGAMERGPTILALTRNTGGYFHGALLSGLVRHITASGGRVIVAQTLDPGTDGSEWLSTPTFHFPVAWDDVDAVVSIALGSNEAYLVRARAEGKPIILASNDIPTLECHVALPDNHGGMRSAVEHLIAHGHTRIGFVGAASQLDYAERHNAYLATMADHGLYAGDDLFFRTPTHALSGGEAAARAFLAATDRPTALVAATDWNALGFMAVVTKAGLSLPDDLAIIGFDDIEDGAFAVPSLTSVGQRFDEVGAHAARLALAALSGEAMPADPHPAEATFLSLRASCGCRTDLVGERPDRRARPIPSPRHQGRARAAESLLTLLGESPRAGTSTATDIDIDKAISVLDDMLASPVEPSDDDTRALMHALTRLATDTETLQRMAAPLTEYTQEVVTSSDVGGRTPGATRALTVLWELKARGYLQRSSRHDTSVLESQTVAGGLLRATGARSRSLVWLAETHVRAGVLALWHGPADEGQLRIAGVYDPDERLDVQVGQNAHVRRFPPAALVDSAEGSTNEMCIVVPVASADHQLGLLALLGRIDITSERETYSFWAEMLCQALASDELQNTVRTSEERYALAAQAANDGLWEWDATTGRTYLSERCRDLLAVPTDTTTGALALTASVHPEDRDAVRTALDAAVTRRRAHVEIEFRVVHANGDARWVLCRALGVAPDEGKVQRLVGSISDVNERKALEDQLRQAALFDPVTGLPNRRLFLDRLERAMQRPRGRTTVKYAVLFLDLDRFKLINDSLGHLMGDELLSVVGERLRTGLRTSDTAARFGGDEFAVLLTGPVEDNLLVVARRIQERIAAPVMLGEQEISITTSIGIAVSEARYATAEDVLRDADAAMYKAKAFKRGTAFLFDHVMRDRAAD